MICEEARRMKRYKACKEEGVSGKGGERGEEAYGGVQLLHWEGSKFWGAQHCKRKLSALAS